MDIELQMSDDTILPLRDVDPEDYYLAIKSLDSRVIALAPSRDARFPRVVAVGNGRGQLLRTSLELIGKEILYLRISPLDGNHLNLS